MADDEIDSLNIASYRAYIINQGNFLDFLKGKSKKDVVNILGKADFINRKSFKKIKGRIGFVYCVGKNTKNNKCRKCGKASITIIFDNGVVTDLIGVFSGG